jgi:hypothetical protein
VLSFATSLSLSETELGLSLKSYEKVERQITNAKPSHFSTSRLCKACACRVLDGQFEGGLRSTGYLFFSADN